jgi:hypothetical protein
VADEKLLGFDITWGANELGYGYENLGEIGPSPDILKVLFNHPNKSQLGGSSA